MLCGLMAGNGNAVLRAVVERGINRVSSPPKELTRSGLKLHLQSRAFSLVVGAHLAPPSSLAMTSASLKRRVFPPIRKLGITFLLAQMQTARSVTE